MRFGTFGNGLCFGEAQHTSTVNLRPVLQSNISPGYMRTQYGFGQRSQRGWTRPEQYTPAAVSAATISDITLTISAPSGAILGRLRTDIEKPVLHSIEFTNDENGCADFSLKLNALPSFEILPFSIVDITIANTSFGWFCGVITTPDEAGTRGGAFANPDKNRPFEYRGFGLRQYLENLKADTDFAALLDVGEVVRQVLRNYAVGVDEATPYSPIRYNESKIETATGIPLASAVELGKFSIRQILDTFAQMGNARWGVDGDGETYFEERTENLKRTFGIGFKVNDFEPQINYDNVKNAIIVQRQQGRGSGGSGWSIAGIYNDVASVRKYGRKELNYQIPGYFEDDDADIIGESLRDSLSEPETSATVEGVVIESASDFFERGTYRFIMPLAEYRETVSDMDDATAYAIIGAGDMTVQNDTTFGNYIYADGGLKFTFQNAANQRAETNIYASGIIKQIRFYVKTSVAGSLIRVGVGENQYDEHTATVDIQTTNDFAPFIWDVSDLNLRKLQKLAFEVIANTSTSVNMWVDKFDIIFRGHKAYRMELKRVTYSFGPQGSVARAEFGELPQSLSDYVSGLLASSSSLKFTGEVR